jgi:hypothetical protein
MSEQIRTYLIVFLFIIVLLLLLITAIWPSLIMGVLILIDTLLIFYNLSKISKF